MASGFGSRSLPNGKAWFRFDRLTIGVSIVLAVAGVLSPLSAQMLMKPPVIGEKITPIPSDLTILDSGEPRSDMSCVISPRKPELGFDLRFHAGYDVTLPMSDLAGLGQRVTVIFRVYPEGDPSRAAYFAQHIQVPAIPDDAKGDAEIEGTYDIGEGKYHVDWLMRDRAERLCASSWNAEASLTGKDRDMRLFIRPSQITQTLEPFADDEMAAKPVSESKSALNVKLLVNFAPQNSLSSSLQRSDTDALVSILKSIQRDPRIGHVSLVAFNVNQERVVYRQQTAESIDFPALGKALETMKLGTVSLASLGEKHSETDFLENLIQQEVGSSLAHPDAVIFAGPKAMLDADVPQDDLRRIGDIECPVFYMNYNLDPQRVPWKDSISHAIRAFRGVEYTISRPRDLWSSTSEMVERIVRNKQQRALSAAASGGGR
jgi:hypothetical protein